MKGLTLSRTLSKSNKNRPPPGSRYATPLRCVSPPLSRRHSPFRHLLRLAAETSSGHPQARPDHRARTAPTATAGP